MATLPTGKAPHELAVSHDGKWVVVTDYGGPDNALTVIDVAERTGRCKLVGGHKLFAV